MCKVNCYSKVYGRHISLCGTIILFEITSKLGLSTALPKKPDCPSLLITLWLHSVKEGIFQGPSPLFCWRCYLILSNVLPWTYWKIRPFSFWIYVVMPSFIQIHHRPVLRVFLFLILAIICYWISGQRTLFFFSPVWQWVTVLIPWKACHRLLSHMWVALWNNSGLNWLMWFLG